MKILCQLRKKERQALCFGKILTVLYETRNNIFISFIQDHAKGK